MDTYEGSIYDPDTLHKYLYANGNPVTYGDPSGNMFDFSSTAMGMGIQNVLNNAVQISYRGLMCGLINMTLTAVMGGSWEQAKSSFVTGFILGAGISVVRYFAVGAELVTLARFYVLSASANFIFSATMTVFAVTKGYSNLAVTFGVMVILSIAEWCWAYGNYLLIDVYGNNGSATIECNPSGKSETAFEAGKKTFDNFNIDDAYVKPKHLSTTGGNGQKFIGGSKIEAESILKEALSNGEIISVADNGLTKVGNQSYEIIIDARKTIGTRGEHLIQIILSEDGGMLSAYPVKD